MFLMEVNGAKGGQGAGTTKFLLINWLEVRVLPGSSPLPAPQAGFLFPPTLAFQAIDPKENCPSESIAPIRGGRCFRQQQVVRAESCQQGAVARQVVGTHATVLVFGSISSLSQIIALFDYFPPLQSEQGVNWGCLLPHLSLFCHFFKTCTLLRTLWESG